MTQLEPRCRIHEWRGQAARVFIVVDPIEGKEKVLIFV
jgi:hypothetical protein